MKLMDEIHHKETFFDETFHMNLFFGLLNKIVVFVCGLDVYNMSCAQNYIWKGHSKFSGDILSLNYIKSCPVGCPFEQTRTIFNSF